MGPVTPVRSSYPLPNAGVYHYQQTIMTIPKAPWLDGQVSQVPGYDTEISGIQAQFRSNQPLPANFTGRQALPLLRGQGTLLTCCASLPSFVLRTAREERLDPCIICSSTLVLCDFFLTSELRERAIWAQMKIPRLPISSKIN